jgi:ribosomal protein L37E
VNSKTASTPVAQLLRDGHKKSHPKCRWDGPHYVPPSLGEPGFFLCERGMLAPPEPTSECRECGGDGYSDPRETCPTCGHEARAARTCEACGGTGRTVAKSD